MWETTDMNHEKLLPNFPQLLCVIDVTLKVKHVTSIIMRLNHAITQYISTIFFPQTDHIYNTNNIL